MEVADVTKMSGLPAGAIAKLELLADQKEAAFALARIAGEKVADARAIMSHRQREIDVFAERPSRPDADLLRRAEAALEQARAEVRRLADRRDRLGGEAQEAGACLASLEIWLRRNVGAEFAPYRGEVRPDRRKGEAPGDAVARVRQHIATLKAELHRVASAPVTLAEARAALRREIDALAEAGRPDVGRLLEGDRLRWPTAILRDHAGHIVDARAANPHALIVWLHRDELLARLEDDLEGVADDTAALSAEQRVAEDRRLCAELLTAEREEEALIESSADLRIARRADASPLAVLGLEATPGLRMGYGE